jgi:hypothetical protein
MIGCYDCDNMEIMLFAGIYDNEGKARAYVVGPINEQNAIVREAEAQFALLIENEQAPSPPYVKHIIPFRPPCTRCEILRQGQKGAMEKNGCF